MRNVSLITKMAFVSPFNRTLWMCGMEVLSMLNSISCTVTCLACKRRKVSRARGCFLKARSITAVRLPWKEFKKEVIFYNFIGKTLSSTRQSFWRLEKSDSRLHSWRQRSDMVNFTFKVANSPVQDSTPCQPYEHGLAVTPAENPKHLLQSSLSFKWILDLCRCLVSYKSGIFLSALFVNLSLLC